jgi:hypothetical protein
VNVIAEEAIGFFDYLLGIPQIELAPAGRADEVHVVHAGCCDYEWFNDLVMVLRRFARKGDKELKKMWRIGFCRSAFRPGWFRNGTEVVLDG